MTATATNATCPRCSGTGTWKNAKGMAVSCLRCAGFGFVLNGDDLATHAASKARRHMTETEELAAAEKAARSTREGALSDRSRANTDARLVSLRGVWAAARSTAEALEALVGTNPKRAAVRAASDNRYDSSCR